MVVGLIHFINKGVEENKEALKNPTVRILRTELPRYRDILITASQTEHYTTLDDLQRQRKALDEIHDVIVDSLSMSNLREISKTIPITKEEFDNAIAIRQQYQIISRDMSNDEQELLRQKRAEEQQKLRPKTFNP